MEYYIIVFYRASVVSENIFGYAASSIDDRIVCLELEFTIYYRILRPKLFF